MQIQIQIQAVVRWQWYDSPWHSPRDKGSVLRPSLQLHSTQLLDLFHNQANNDSQVLFNSTLPNSWKSPFCNPSTLHLCRSNISLQATILETHAIFALFRLWNSEDGFTLSESGVLFAFHDFFVRLYFLESKQSLEGTHLWNHNRCSLFFLYNLIWCCTQKMVDGSSMLYSIKSVGRRELTYAFLCAAIRVLCVLDFLPENLVL